MQRPSESEHIIQQLTVATPPSRAKASFKDAPFQNSYSPQ